MSRGRPVRTPERGGIRTDALTRAPLAVSDATLEDLAGRLQQVRWPDALSAGWDLGTDADTLRALVEHWRTGFDWRRQERALEDALPSYRARVGEHDLHVAIRRGRGEHPFPLLLLHGWPGSYAEFAKVAGPLAEPAAHAGDPLDAFDLIVPSLPGHGLSSAPADPGFNADDGADVLRTLLVDVLGVPRFGVQGGDRGAMVAMSLGHRHPAHVTGIHLNLATGIAAPPETRSAEEDAWLERQARWFADEGGYSAIQSTRPQTLAYALSDSPVGLAGWILEKWKVWSDPEAGLEGCFTRDELLTNIMLYWATGTIHASIRWYAAHRRRPPAAMRPERIPVPTAVADFPHESVRVPRSAVARKVDLRQWTTMPRGGHFAAMEQPELLVEDIRKFFRGLRAPQPRRTR
jgi:pimeloyl-ACP methyl ester carboxylesterase